MKNKNEVEQPNNAQDIRDVIYGFEYDKNVGERIEEAEAVARKLKEMTNDFMFNVYSAMRKIARVVVAPYAKKYIEDSCGNEKKYDNKEINVPGTYKINGEYNTKRYYEWGCQKAKLLKSKIEEYELYRGKIYRLLLDYAILGNLGENGELSDIICCCMDILEMLINPQYCEDPIFSLNDVCEINRIDEQVYDKLPEKVVYTKEKIGNMKRELLESKISKNEIEFYDKNYMCRMDDEKIEIWNRMANIRECSELVNFTEKEIEEMEAILWEDTMPNESFRRIEENLTEDELFNIKESTNYVSFEFSEYTMKVIDNLILQFPQIVIQNGWELFNEFFNFHYDAVRYEIGWCGNVEESLE